MQNYATVPLNFYYKINKVILVLLIGKEYNKSIVFYLEERG